jgi:hypothetical protein
MVSQWRSYRPRDWLWGLLIFVVAMLLIVLAVNLFG